MKLKNPLLMGAAGLAASTAVRSWMATLGYKAAFYDPLVDPVHPDFCGQKIYVFWHEYILIPLHMRGHCNLAMLISQHSDADLLSRAAHHMGFEFVRGSSRRGGVTALRELLRKSGNMNLAITPDGPRGPRRKLAAGPVYLASRLQMPLVVMGLGVDRPWRTPTWDRFCIPRPWSRARAVISPALHVPAGLDREGIEHWRLSVETLLNRLTLEAETWAEAGTRKVGEVVVNRQPQRHRRERAQRAVEAPTSLALFDGEDDELRVA